MEVSVESEGGRLRPDAIVRIPGGKSLVIDAKVSLNAYQDAHGAVDETERATHMAAHVASMKTHINALGAKARSEEHTSELQSLMRISYAVFCLKNKNKNA